MDLHARIECSYVGYPRTAGDSPYLPRIIQALALDFVHLLRP